MYKINNTKSLKTNLIFNSLRTFLNIGFPLVTFPYVTRILSPNGLGIYDFNKSIVSYFILIAGLGISQYAIREGSRKKSNLQEFQEFCEQIFSINLFSTIFSYILLFCLISIFLKNPNDYLLVMIFSTQMIFNLLSVEWIFFISEDFKYITIRSFIVQLISLVLLFTLVRDETDYINYALITVFSMGISSLFNIIYSRKIVKFKLSFNLNNSVVHLKPIFILFFNNIASTIYLSSDTTIIGIVSGNYYVGIYSTAVKIYTIVRQITTTILMTAIPRLSSLNQKNEEEYTKLLNKIFEMMMLLIFPSILGLILLRKQVVLIIAGSSFLDSISSLFILSICLLFAIVSGFFVHGILLVNNREKIILKITVFSAILNIVLNMLLVPIFQEKGAAFATLISEIIIAIWSAISSRDIYKINISKNAILSIFVGCITIFIICNIFTKMTEDIFLQTVICVLLSVLCYGSILKFFLKR